MPGGWFRHGRLGLRKMTFLDTRIKLNPLTYIFYVFSAHNFGTNNGHLPHYAAGLPYRCTVGHLRETALEGFMRRYVLYTNFRNQPSVYFWFSIDDYKYSKLRALPLFHSWYAYL